MKRYLIHLKREPVFCMLADSIYTVEDYVRAEHARQGWCITHLMAHDTQLIDKVLDLYNAHVDREIIAKKLNILTVRVDNIIFKYG